MSDEEEYEVESIVSKRIKKGKVKNSLKYSGKKLTLLLFLKVFRVRKFLGLPDPNPSVRGTDPDPFIIKQQ